MASKFNTLITQRSAVEMQALTKKSMNWMLEKISEIKNPSRVVFGKSNKPGQNNTFRLGGLYSFYYDPKTKDDLPYYDRFPMVIALERYPDGFLGLNLHYLPLNYRVAFLSKLADYASYNANDEVQRLRVTYDILSASKRLREFRPCIKKYLLTQVQSKIITIQPEEWEAAALLPLHQFRKASASKVWNESIEEIRKQ